MRTMVVRAALAAAVAAAAMGTVMAASAEDDLAVVKRAVARRRPRQSRRRPAPARGRRGGRGGRRDAERPAASTGATLRWFKVRVTEKGAKKARVNVNLPIALVRALGDDFPIDIGRHGRWRRRARPGADHPPRRGPGHPGGRPVPGRDRRRRRDRPRLGGISSHQARMQLTRAARVRHPRPSQLIRDSWHRGCIGAVRVPLSMPCRCTPAPPPAGP